MVHNIVGLAGSRRPLVWEASYEFETVGITLFIPDWSSKLRGFHSTTKTTVRRGVV